MSGIIAFFRASPPKAGAAFDEHRFRRVRWQTFIAMTLAYVTFYVCRLSFTVAKSALVELGITPTELGMIGSTLFFSYAIGKLVNGFIADHANVVRYMSLGLCVSSHRYCNCLRTLKEGLPDVDAAYRCRLFWVLPSNCLCDETLSYARDCEVKNEGSELLG